MNKLLTEDTLRQRSRAHAGTGGISDENRTSGFRPAFRDPATGRTELARFADGRPAPMHLLDGLPDAWVARRDAFGHVTATKRTIIAGFIRCGLFYTRQQAAAAMH